MGEDKAWEMLKGKAAFSTMINPGFVYKGIIQEPDVMLQKYYYGF